MRRRFELSDETWASIAPKARPATNNRRMVNAVLFACSSSSRKTRTPRATPSTARSCGHIKTRTEREKGGATDRAFARRSVHEDPRRRRRRWAPRLSRSDGGAVARTSLAGATTQPAMPRRDPIHPDAPRPASIQQGDLQAPPPRRELLPATQALQARRNPLREARAELLRDGLLRRGTHLAALIP